MAQCDTHPLHVPVDEATLVGDHTANDILLYFAIACTTLACILSMSLIYRHATNYTAPAHQKQIIRILFMVPVYSICCTLSIVYYEEHVYIAAIYEFYESIAIAAFTILMCLHIRSDWDGVRKVFNLLTPKKWLRPLRLFHMCFRRGKRGQPSSGLKWFNIVTFCILQFVFIKFFGAIAKMITEAADVYCAASNSTEYASIWIQIVEIISLAIAMLFLFQFYEQIKEALKNQNPLMKLLGIKLVVALFYLQTFIFGRVTGEDGAWQTTDYLSYPTLAAGFPNAILTFEMLVVAIIHLFAYSAKPYLVKNINSRMKTGGDQMHESWSGRIVPGFEHLHPDIEVKSGGGTLGIRAYLDACNVWDIIYVLYLSFYWVFISNSKVDSEHYDEERVARDPVKNGATPHYRTTNLMDAITMG
jgi:hypothetical protein